MTMEPTLKSVDAMDRARHVIKDIGDDLNISVSVFSSSSCLAITDCFVFVSAGTFTVWNFRKES